MNTNIVPIERVDNGALIVSSLTIAEGSGVEHRAVLQLINKSIEDLELFGTVAFEMRPLPGGGNPLRIALLNEQQSTLLMTYQRNTDQVRAFKRALVKAFFEMAAQIQVPSAPAELSRMEILQMAIAAEQESESLRAARAIDAPKVEYVDQYVADEDLLLVSTVASTNNLREKQLRELLAARNWIFCQTSTRWSDSNGEKVPMRRWSEFADYKPYFMRNVNHAAPRFKGEVMHTLKVTPAGANAIARLIERTVKEFGSVDVAIAELEHRKELKKVSA